VAHRGGGRAPIAHGDERTASRELVLENAPLDARKDEVRERASIDVRTRPVDEAQDDDLVAEKVMDAAGAAGGVEHVAVRRLAERWQLVCARRGRRIAERRPAGR
jgi:hypothetical protein